LALCLSLAAASGQVNTYRGLWVGQVTLARVNEVTVPLDENNVARAPDPNVPTPTADAAHLRLILHVNGAGQVALLKDVAILARRDPANGLLLAESDLALVTDERLYGAYPPQPATRLASAVFDFGDSRATDALDAVVDAAVTAAVDRVLNHAADAATAESAALAAAEPVVEHANVAEAFDRFMQDDLDSAVVNTLVNDGDPADAWAAASNLHERSFYSDGRGLEMVSNVLAAIEQAGTNMAARRHDAHNMAAALADVEDGYQRFLAGKPFGDMIVSAAETAAAVAADGGGAASVRAAVETNQCVIDAREGAWQVAVPRYDDTRGSDAVDAVVDAIVSAAVGASGAASEIERIATEAGRDALANDVPRYAHPPSTPTPDYDAFVLSDAFRDSAGLAAGAAADGAFSETNDNQLWTEQSVKDAALLAAVNALDSAYAEAARAVRNELPLNGVFGPGQGDPRLVGDLGPGGALGSAALEGTIFLPARHPTNPFRHRRHPDHTVGFDVRRHIRMDFDGTPTNALEEAGFGVERISGTYREEIEGLHKLLGPNKNIGLRTEGPFELDRVSLIDTLNGQ